MNIAAGSTGRTVLRTSLRVAGQPGVRFNWYLEHKTRHKYGSLSQCDQGPTRRRTVDNIVNWHVSEFMGDPKNTSNIVDQHALY